MSYFGDILDDAEKRLGDGEYEFADDGKLFKAPAIKLVSAKVKSAPAKGLSLAQGADLVAKGGDKFDHKHKTEVKYAVADEHDSKLTVTNKDWTATWDYAPAQFCKDGKEVTFEAEFKRVPTDGSWSGKFENKCGGYPMGPIKGWSELQVDLSGKDREVQDTELTFSQTLNHTDFWLGTRFVSPLPKPALSSAAATLLYTNGPWDLWARGSFIRKAFGSGFTWRQMDGLTHSSELIYDMKPDGKNKGLFGTPLFWRYGMSLKSQNVAYDLRLQAMNGSVIASHKSTCPVDKNTKLTLSVQENASAWFSDRKAAFAALKVGFAVEYKC